jgi:thiol-disulfide isomerase/thioredoxin
MKKIIEFYGETCSDCIAFAPEVARLEKEGEVEFEKIEVWNNEKNAKRMEDLKQLYGQECDGNMVVPSFYDKEKERLVCEPGSYEKLKSWVFEKEG